MNETTMRVLRRDHVSRLVKGIVDEWITDIMEECDADDPLTPSLLKDCLGDLADRLTEELA